MRDEAQLLAEMGHDVVLAPSPFHHMEALTRQLTGIAWAPWAVPPFLDEWHHHRINSLRVKLNLFRILREPHPDLVHVFLPWTNQGLTRLWIAANAGIPAVVSVHNCFPETTFAPRVRSRLAQAFSTLEGIYAVGPSAKQGFLRNFGTFLPPHVEPAVIGNFVDMDRFKDDEEARAVARQRFGLSDHHIVVGAVGRIAEQKAPMRLLHAFAAIVARNSRATCLMIGDGPMRTAVEEEARRLGLADRLHITGWVDPSQYLPALDVCMLASEREGFGIASVEALACGVPVVACRSPGSEDVLGQCPAASLVEPSAMALADAVASLTAESGRRSVMKRQARAFVKGRYDKLTWYHQVAAFYQRIFSSRTICQ